MFPDPSQAPVELQTISVTAELLTALVQIRNNVQVNQRNCIDKVINLQMTVVVVKNYHTDLINIRGNAH